MSAYQAIFIARIMIDKGPSEITQILNDWNNGDDDAEARLMPFVYEELKRQARILMSRERSDHTLEPTALVHEAFIQLNGDSGVEWKNRSHFYGVASRLMRQILVQHARRHAAAKRGSNPIHFSIDDLQIPIEGRARSIVKLDEALERLAELDEKQAMIVEMRFFGGLSNKEIAEALKVSERSVVRIWQAVRLWLFRELQNE